MNHAFFDELNPVVERVYTALRDLRVFAADKYGEEAEIVEGECLNLIETLKGLASAAEKRALVPAPPVTST